MTSNEIEAFCQPFYCGWANDYLLLSEILRLGDEAFNEDVSAINLHVSILSLLRFYSFPAFTLFLLLMAFPYFESL